MEVRFGNEKERKVRVSEAVSCGVEIVLIEDGRVERRVRRAEEVMPEPRLTVNDSRWRF